MTPSAQSAKLPRGFRKDSRRGPSAHSPAALRRFPRKQLGPRSDLTEPQDARRDSPQLFGGSSVDVPSAQSAQKG